MPNTALSEEQLAGQRLMVGFDGTDFNADLEYLIRQLKVGGIILFARNIVNPSQLQRLCQAIQDCARACDLPPMLIAVDQEGGQVARLRAPFTEFPGNPAMASPADAVNFATVTARELASVGINMNMAPVLDVAPSDIDSVMAARVFGHDPQHVALMGAAVIDHLQDSGIIAVAKHFPGIGRTTLDSHLDLPELAVAPDDLEAFDLPPFHNAIAHQVGGMMLSHIRYTRIDPRWPASLSVALARDLLRQKMGFEGVVMTDDLDMGAVAKHFDIRTAIGRIIEADIDIALICHRSGKIETAHAEILHALGASPAAARRGLAAAGRILALKKTYLD